MMVNLTRYHNDPEYREHIKTFEREKYHNDPAHRARKTGQQRLKRKAIKKEKKPTTPCERYHSSPKVRSKKQEYNKRYRASHPEKAAQFYESDKKRINEYQKNRYHSDEKYRENILGKQRNKRVEQRNNQHIPALVASIWVQI